MEDDYEADFDESGIASSPAKNVSVVASDHPQPLAESMRADDTGQESSASAVAVNDAAEPALRPHSKLEENASKENTPDTQPVSSSGVVSPAKSMQQPLRIVHPVRTVSPGNRSSPVRSNGGRNSMLKKRPTDSSTGGESSGSPSRRTSAVREGMFASPTGKSTAAGSGSVAGVAGFKPKARQSSMYVASQSTLPVVSESDPAPSPPPAREGGSFTHAQQLITLGAGIGLASRSANPLAHATTILASLEPLVTSSLATAAVAHAMVLSPGTQGSAPFSSAAAATSAAHGFNELHALLREAQLREKEWIKKEKSWADADKLWQEKFNSAREQSAALLAAKEKAVHALTNKVAAVAAQNEKLKAAVNTSHAGERLHELENVKREKDMIIGRLNEEVKALQAMNRQLARKLDDSEAAIGKAGLPAKVDTLHTELKGEKERNKKLRAEYLVLEEAHKRQGEQLYQLTDTVKELRTRCEVLSRSLAAATGQPASVFNSVGPGHTALQEQQAWGDRETGSASVPGSIGTGVGSRQHGALKSKAGLTSKAAAGTGRAAVKAASSRGSEEQLSSSVRRGSSIRPAAVLAATSRPVLEDAAQLTHGGQQGDVSKPSTNAAEAEIARLQRELEMARTERERDAYRRAALEEAVGRLQLQLRDLGTKAGLPGQITSNGTTAGSVGVPERAIGGDRSTLPVPSLPLQGLSKGATAGQTTQRKQHPLAADPRNPSPKKSKSPLGKVVSPPSARGEVATEKVESVTLQESGQAAAPPGQIVASQATPALPMPAAALQAQRTLLSAGFTPQQVQAMLAFSSTMGVAYAPQAGAGPYQPLMHPTGGMVLVPSSMVPAPGAVPQSGVPVSTSSVEGGAGAPMQALYFAAPPASGNSSGRDGGGSGPSILSPAILAGPGSAVPTARGREDSREGGTSAALLGSHAESPTVPLLQRDIFSAAPAPVPAPFLPAASQDKDTGPGTGEVGQRKEQHQEGPQQATMQYVSDNSTMSNADVRQELREEALPAAAAAAATAHHASKPTCTPASASEGAQGLGSVQDKTAAAVGASSSARQHETAEESDGAYVPTGMSSNSSRPASGSARNVFAPPPFGGVKPMKPSDLF